MMKITMRYRAKLHPYLDILCDSLGRVFLPGDTNHKARWTFGCLHSNGYRTVKIDYKVYRVARLICETFHGLAPEDRPTCDHISRDRDSNVPWNLRWSDYKQQVDNTQRVINRQDYGVRACDDPVAYMREYRAENAERHRALCREYRARQKELGRRRRKCPDGSRRWLTREEFFKEYGYWPKK